jgi:hypothetical protein
MLTNRLKSGIWNKLQGLLLKGIDRQYSAAHTAETLRKLKSDTMDHSLYSPDFALSDYNLFGPLKEALRVIDSS